MTRSQGDSYPQVEVDLRHRLLLIALNDRVVVSTGELDDAHLVDLDADGRAVALEILDPADMKLEEMAHRFGFADELPAIHLALGRSFDDVRKVVG